MVSALRTYPMYVLNSILINMEYTYKKVHIIKPSVNIPRQAEKVSSKSIQPFRSSSMSYKFVYVNVFFV